MAHARVRGQGKCGRCTSVSDGIYVVGQDMQPGTYRVTAAVADRCYWQITKSGSNGRDRTAGCTR